jgi:small subunit ribosomal protein S20
MRTMPIIKSAKKKLRADARKQKVNQKIEATFKLAVKNFKKDPSQEALKKAYSALDIAAKKGVIPKKRADRKKGRLATLVAIAVTKPAKKSTTQRKAKNRSAQKP